MTIGREPINFLRPPPLTLTIIQCYAITTTYRWQSTGDLETMKRLTLNQKLWGIVALLWVGLFIVVLMMALFTRPRIPEKPRSLLKQEVDMALQTVSFFQK